VICQIVILYMVMVTESFGYRLSPHDWSNLFSEKEKFWIGTLYMVMVTEFLDIDFPSGLV